jgi:ParB family chromosome partitioning protein
MQSSLKKGLGRGLSSLLGDTTKKIETNKVDINNLIRNKFQPRKNFNKENLEELTASIKEQGVIQPIVVRPDKSSQGKYEIIAGERRWLASQNAGLHEVPVVILNVDDAKSLEFAIVENVQRQDLNSIEEAEGYKRLMNEFNYNQEKLSQFIGKSRSYITNTIRLLSLSSEIINHVENGLLSAGHARTLIGIVNAENVAKQIIDKKLSVRQAEQLVKALKSKNIVNKISKKDINIIDLEKTLEEKTGLDTSIYNRKNNTGKISFEYKNLDQLERLVSIIKKNY